MTPSKRSVNKQSVRYTADYAEPATGMTGRIVATVCWDDRCSNGHNTFSITGSCWERKRGDIGRASERSGCIHDDIAKRIPELIPFLKWHLCSANGPLHYVANTVYLAGNRDHRGKAAGEPIRFERCVMFGNDPVGHVVSTSFSMWLSMQDFRATGAPEIVRVNHSKEPGETPYLTTFGPKFTFAGYPMRQPGYEDVPPKWCECPFDSLAEAEAWRDALVASNDGIRFFDRPVDFSEGKARDLDAARGSAIWPDATDEDLTAPGLKERLEARLPALMEAFKADIEKLGFVW